MNWIRRQLRLGMQTYADQIEQDARRLVELYQETVAHRERWMSTAKGAPIMATKPTPMPMPKKPPMPMPQPPKKMPMDHPKQGMPDSMWREMERRQKG